MIKERDANDRSIFTKTELLEFSICAVQSNRDAERSDDQKALIKKGVDAGLLEMPEEKAATPKKIDETGEKASMEEQMKKLVENQDGLFAIQKEEGETTFFFGKCEKDSDTYNEKLAEGFELDLMPQAEKDAHEQEKEIEKENQEALSYLSSTDWYVIRSLDSGEPIPDDVKAGRAQARAAIK